LQEGDIAVRSRNGSALQGAKLPACPSAFRGSPDSPQHKECNGGESESRRGHRDLMWLRAAWAAAMVTLVGL